MRCHTTDLPADDFTAYLELLGTVLTETDQRASFALYAMGLLSPLSRKSVEPLAALSCQRAQECSAAHQRLLHFLANTDWDNEAVRRVATGYALAAMTQPAPVEVSIVDDTGFLKQGKHSTFVQRQYTGSAGKVTNCQLCVSLTMPWSSRIVSAFFPPVERNPKQMVRTEERKQRHQPASMATMCARFGRTVLGWLPRCPHCHRRAVLAIHATPFAGRRRRDAGILGFRARREKADERLHDAGLERVLAEEVVADVLRRSAPIAGT